MSNSPYPLPDHIHLRNNGNYNLKINLQTGTKHRDKFGDEDKYIAHLPESIDLKITGYCDMSHICTFCHEGSTKEGDHADSKTLQKFARHLPAGTEIAIGGGNPLAHPFFKETLGLLNMHECIPSVTINQLHLKKYGGNLKRSLKGDDLYGLGISYRRGVPMNAGIYNTVRDYPHTVWHLILGVHNISDLQVILDHNPNAKILLLGYKTSGFGQDYKDNNKYKIKKNLHQWTRWIGRLMERNVFLSFDTLAIKQLDMRRFFTKDQWMNLYMGGDGQYTMYVDIVNEVAKPSSFSPDSQSIAFSSHQGFDMQNLFSQIKHISKNGNTTI